ncbi:MAG: glutamate--tRNA ligase, partial [Candidatus Nanoarchaeia archaeon]|nr:glutamate--tRNA ligase [Candidatus Nanoarchaeia archaeon]
KKYDGKVIFRFDDTNPEKSTQEYVDSAKEDVLNYLDIKPDELLFASEHMEKYYQYAEKLVNENQAYVCSCPQEKMSDGRRNGTNCIHRNQTLEENKLFWQQMKEGKFKEGEVVLRLKIDMQHKNAVMRDPVIYRLAYASHYKVGTKYKVWPMYDFESTIEEGLCNITHVMRSNEFDSRIELQKYIAKLFNFPEIEYIHYGRYNVVGATTQGREIRELIQTGNYIGWDDPRLVTLRALKRRGIVKEAYYELAQKIGLSKTQTNLDFSSIAAINRALLDKTAKRFFGVVNPVLIKINNFPTELIKINLKHHPEQEEKNRTLDLTNEFYVEKEDLVKIEDGQIFRLMDCINVKMISETEFEYHSKTIDEFKSSPNKSSLIHYVPKNGKELHAEILMDDISIKEIVCEQSLENLKIDEVVQFERLFFCRLDQIEEDGTRIFWFTHK